jgi:hypothetical protein
VAGSPASGAHLRFLCDSGMILSGVAATSHLRGHACGFSRPVPQRTNLGADRYRLDLPAAQSGTRFSARFDYVFEKKQMLRSRMLFVSLALTAAFGIGAATSLAQTQSTPPKDTSASAQASQTMTDVSKWTRRQWHDAKAKWQEEKDAWNGCQNEAKTQNLSGRKSWQFLYDCMTKS